MSKSIGHAIMVAACGLGVAILSAIVPAAQQYHPTGFIANIFANSITPLIVGGCAGLIHFLTQEENDKTPGA